MKNEISRFFWGLRYTEVSKYYGGVKNKFQDTFSKEKMKNIL